MTVCHYCNQVFATEAARYDFSVTSYVRLVAQALGIHRQERFTTYALWGGYRPDRKRCGRPHIPVAV